jgi:hypothetical protein
MSNESDLIEPTVTSSAVMMKERVLLCSHGLNIMES